MSGILAIFDYFLHLDKHMATLVASVGNWVYVILFLIIFAETGLVIAPFLPGDSLLFVAGTLAGGGYLNITIVYITLLAAAIIGDTVNYWVGHYLGKKVFEKENSKIFKKEYLEKTQDFYKKHGSKAIILARFLPILRTFAPFVAGVGKMDYKTFISFNVIGALLWVTGFTYAGYFFGGLEFVQKNFHYAVLLIIVLSIIPAVMEFLNYQKEKKMHK